MKDLFHDLQGLMAKVNEIEDGLQGLRDRVSLSTKESINDSIRGVQALRDLLWKVDKSLENENEDAKDAARLFKELDGELGG